MSEVQTQGGGGGKGLARPANGGESPRGKARGFRKVRLGRVVSDKMEKTVVVQVQDLKSHPLYKKVMKHRVRFKVHDERNEAKVGDLVRITETRPLSKEKRWRVVEIVEKAR